MEISEEQRTHIEKIIGIGNLARMEIAAQAEHILAGQCGELPNQLNRAAMIYCTSLIVDKLDDINATIAELRET